MATKSAPRSIPLDEVSQHNSRDSCWMVIGEGVYDVTTFVDRHPGGDFIMQGAGRDSSVMFYTTHPKRVQGMLSKYYIGDVVRPDTVYHYSWDSKFYDTLQDRVESFFKENNVDHHYGWEQVFMTLLTLAGFFYCSYAAYFQGHWWATIPLGWFMSQIGVQIMHDGNHGASSSHPFLSSLAGKAMDMLGGSSFVWRHQHNIGHHQHTNTHEDPDINTAYPILRFNPTQRWLWYHQYQHLYIWVAYALQAWKWFFADMANVLITRQYKDIVMKPSIWDVLWLGLSKGFVFTWHFLMPMYFNGIVKGFCLMVLSVTTASYGLALQFVVNHMVEECFYLKGKDGDGNGTSPPPSSSSSEPLKPSKSGASSREDPLKDQSDWAICQVVTSANYGTDSLLCSVLSGGLNMQIEHHLFPSIAHQHLRHISPIVKKTCEEFNVPYFSYGSFSSAVYSHYKFLRRLGVRPQ